LAFGGIFDLDSIVEKITLLENQTNKQDFWLDSSNAKITLKEISQLKSKLSFIEDLDSNYEELKICNEIIEDQIVEKDYIDILNQFQNKVDEFELKSILNEDDDIRDCIISIHPGAGGTESQDWAEMLLRMYSRWVESKGFKNKILDYQQGDEAGIKDVSIEIKGEFAYGYLKGEKGVHRLVRISPFDSNGKRHTSFASVFVNPVIDDEIDIDINEKDLKIDTYRASGAGGQHVNKTDSAVRITHVPSSIVVQCQNERSQLKNKNTAMKILKSRLYQKRLDERKEDLEQISGDKKDISWGSQIRSYVFHPYNLIKDHRTDMQTSNIGSFMDGDIDLFIKEYLINNMEKK
tara:strand:+ start:3132 stop:4178 length:1047 start_codon:yes stop_codon:yes gene_type:complete